MYYGYSTVPHNAEIHLTIRTCMYTVINRSFGSYFEINVPPDEGEGPQLKRVWFRVVGISFTLYYTAPWGTCSVRQHDSLAPQIKIQNIRTYLQFLTFRTRFSLQHLFLRSRLVSMSVKCLKNTNSSILSQRLTRTQRDEKVTYRSKGYMYTCTARHFFRGISMQNSKNFKRSSGRREFHCSGGKKKKKEREPVVPKCTFIGKVHLSALCCFTVSSTDSLLS